MALRSFLRRRATMRLGLKLLKTFLAFFAGYIVCLVPRSAAWLGPYGYLLAVSVILNHPGRAVGPQLDGAFFVSFGAVVGLLWGAVAMKAASSTYPSQVGTGLLAAFFLFVSCLAIGWLVPSSPGSTNACCRWGSPCSTCVSPTSCIPSTWPVSTSGRDSRPLPSRGSVVRPSVSSSVSQCIRSAEIFLSRESRKRRVLTRHFSNCLLRSSFHRAFHTIVESLVLPRPSSESFEAKLGLRFVEILASRQGLHARCFVHASPSLGLEIPTEHDPGRDPGSSFDPARGLLPPSGGRRNLKDTGPSLGESAIESGSGAQDCTSRRNPGGR